MHKLILFFLAIVMGQLLQAQQNPVVQDYINTYKQLAIDEMQRTGVPAAIKLAQGIHETEAGRSELVMKSNNHFGIKCKTSWSGAKVYHDDDARGECFRSYGAPDESYRDHSNFLKSNQRYAFLFQLDPADYKAWAYGLKKAGYATNIKYSQLLIKLIETYELQQYSLIAMGKLPPTSDLLTGIRPPAVNEPADAVPSMVYPTGVFNINETKVVFVKAGTSLQTLANSNHLSLSRLLDFNDMTADEGDILVEDQLVFLQRKRKTGADLFHYVKKGETLYTISQAQGIRYESILAFNHLSVGMEPAVGERLFLKEKSPSSPLLATGAEPMTALSNPAIAASPTSAAQAVFTRHIVRTRETLYGIGKRYGVSLNQLMEWNKLNNEALKTGQELIIYTN